jgi:HNH endonuclease
MRRKALRRSVVLGQACVYCGAPAQEADHVMPTSRGGSEERHNLVPACLHCNRSKGARARPKRRRFRDSYFHTPAMSALSTHRESEASSRWSPEAADSRRYSTTRGNKRRRLSGGMGDEPERPTIFSRARIW